MRADVIILLICTIHGSRARSYIVPECTTAADCEVKGSICENSVCTCSPSYVQNSYDTECLPVAHGYGSNCTDNLQCSTSLKSGGYCFDGACSCLDGYHYLKGMCWKTSGLGDSCARSENCLVTNDFEASVCSTEKKCVCAKGYYQREYSTCRLRALKPGDPCGIPIDCKFDGSTCFWNRTCGYATSDSFEFGKNSLDSDSQYPNVYCNTEETSRRVDSKISDNCSTSSDCPRNAECTDGVCFCLQGFYSLDDSSCNPELGSSCTVDSDCKGKNTMCRNQSICACQEGFTMSKNRRFCDKLSRYLHWSCLSDVWCSYFGENSVCVNKKCTCNNESHYVPEQMFCWITRRAGEQCFADTDCGLSGMSCTKGICSCAAGFHPSSSAESCHKDALSLGSPCAETFDCMFPHGYCDPESQKCVCSSGYYNKDGECLLGIGGLCLNDSECRVTKTHCGGDGRCVCDDDYVSNNDNTTCLSMTKSIWGSCSETRQCLKFDAVCTNGSCSCPNDTHYIVGWSCFRDVRLGDECEKDGECIDENTSCLKYRCSCNHGLRSVNNIYCSRSSIVSVFTPLFFWPLLYNIFRIYV